MLGEISKDTFFGILELLISDKSILEARIFITDRQLGDEIIGLGYLKFIDHNELAIQFKGATYVLTSEHNFRCFSRNSFNKMVFKISIGDFDIQLSI